MVYSPRGGAPPTSWNASVGEFDYGGAAMIGPLLANYSVEAPRVLKRSGGSYWYAYYGQPRRNGYELDPGGSGLARSTDGLDWERGSATPFLSTTDPAAEAWEQDCEYAPFLLESGGALHAIWNAKGSNAQGKLSEARPLRPRPQPRHLAPAPSGPACAGEPPEARRRRCSRRPAPGGRSSPRRRPDSSPAPRPPPSQESGLATLPPDVPLPGTVPFRRHAVGEGRRPERRRGAEPEKARARGRRPRSPLTEARRGAEPEVKL